MHLYSYTHEVNLTNLPGRSLFWGVLIRSDVWYNNFCHHLQLASARSVAKLHYAHCAIVSLCLLLGLLLGSLVRVAAAITAQVVLRHLFVGLLSLVELARH